MDRGSAQHGGRLDDEMAHEVESLTRGAPLESRSREDREVEPPAEGEPVPAELLASIDLSDHDALELRSELARHLRPSAFPADALTLLTVARAEGAPDTMLTLIGHAPGGRAYRNVAELWEAIGGATERRATPDDEAERQEADLQVAVESRPSAPGGLMATVRGLTADLLDLGASVLREAAERIRPRD